ncbi:MAG TPA: hypothetical protein VFA65_07025 [Bryobacteraceae bacterium]|nr:hypothetical protein [Bryobacteraceae bacterium]
MRRMIAICALALSFGATLPASEFDWLVREFSRQSGAEQTHIPLFGLVRFTVAVAHPAGTSELRLALFEHASLEPRKFAELTDSVVGGRWKPIIRVRSRDREATNIYAQQDGKELRLLVTTLDGHEATFVQIRVKPEQLMKFIDDHGGRMRKAM